MWKTITQREKHLKLSKFVKYAYRYEENGHTDHLLPVLAYHFILLLINEMIRLFRLEVVIEIDFSGLSP